MPDVGWDDLSIEAFLHEIAVRSQRQPGKDHSHISDCRIASV